MPVLANKDFAELFGTTEAHVRSASGPLIDAIDLHLRTIEGVERDGLLLSILKRIHSPELKDAGDHREADWEDGWRENLEEFVQSGYALESLIPKYYKANVPIRLRGQYVLPTQPDFVFQYTKIFRAWLFREYLTEYPSVYEFGCGTGHNLVHLAQLYPGKKLYGLDWARSSQEILHELAIHCGMNVHGAHFDFFNPDERLALEPGSAVLTFGALEQVGPNHGRYLDFILAHKPARCVDVIGIHELYDPATLLDYMALLYHQRRNYLNGYLTRLQELEAAGRIEILKIQRHAFGNLYDDPYSFVVWKPV